MEMKTAVVTGASGHIGNNLTRILLEEGWHVRTLIHRDVRALAGLDVERVSGDIMDLESLRGAFLNADYVFHTAALVSVGAHTPSRKLRVNVEGVRNVTRACRDAGVSRLVHFSSIHALSEHPMDRPIRETNELCGKKDRHALPYSRSKAAGEREIAKAVADGLDVVTVNPTGVIGPHDYKVSAAGIALRDLANAAVPALVPGAYDFVDVRDVARTALAAAQKGRTGERYLIPGHLLRVRDMANLVTKETQVPAPRFDCPMWIARLGAPLAEMYAKIRGGRPKFTSGSLRVLEGNAHVSGEKSKAEFGYAPRPIQETIRDTLAWQREAGWLKGRS